MSPDDPFSLPPPQMAPPEAPQIPPVDQSPAQSGTLSRAALVARAIDSWAGQIIDLGGRNTLLFYRDLRQGTLDLTPSARIEGSVVEQLLDNRTVRLSRLNSDGGELQPLAKRARTIKAKATENLEERGLGTLFIAHGMATWTHARSDATPAAPVLLAALSLKPSGGAGEDFELAVEGDWEINPTLLHLLASDFQVSIDSDEVLGTVQGPAALDHIVKLARSVPDFRVDRRVVVGNFSYAKQPMALDIQNSLEAMVGHPVVSAIAGSPEALCEMIENQPVTDPSEPDHTPPDNEFLILDADASQSSVVNAALRGANLVVQGPPGTGKSQTIANLIAACAARGKSVLFVAEKRAAIEAVTNRLGAVDLESLVLDLHGGTRSRRQTLGELRQVLDGFRTVPALDRSDQNRTLTHTRDHLNGFDAALHQKREHANLSAFDLQASLLAVPAGAQSDLTVATSIANATSWERLEELERALVEYVKLGGSTTGDSLHAWEAATGHITTEEQARSALELAQSLATETVPAATILLNTVLSECGLRRPVSIADWTEAISLLQGVEDTLSKYDPAIFQQDFEALHTSLEPAEHAVPARAGSRVFNSRYRDALKTMKSLALAKQPSAMRRASVLKAWEQAHAWSQLSVDGHGPRRAPSLGQSTAGLQTLTTQLASLGAFLGGDNGLASDLAATQQRTDRLLADRPALFRLPRLFELRTTIETAGYERVLHEITSRRITSDLAGALLRGVWLRTILDNVCLSDQRIGAFEASSHEGIVEQFREVDRDHIIDGPRRVLRHVAERAVACLDEFPDQAQLVRQQAGRKRGHLPLRSLLQQAPEVLKAIKPCWAMSPLVVSQVLPAESDLFDLVVFDEASQIPPAEAIPAVLRGRQIIVTGDTKQLPPTAFFASSHEEDDEDESTAGLVTKDMESILDAMVALLAPPHGSKTLTWHYRSHDERLIAFSNAQESLYNWTLTTFPGVASGESIQHRLVPWRSPAIGSESSMSDEVDEVAQLIKEHARNRPEESLGVITMGIKHADRISERIRIERKTDRQLDEYCELHHDEPFFVKNLERVQGDERDAIIISIGYGKSIDGRMVYRFGPLNTDGGERRLNVAATRAKRRLTLVSSFSHEEMDDGKLRAEGARMLKRYLRYCASGGTDLGHMTKPEIVMNPFESDVHEHLTAAGIPLTAQLGVSGYWIDFAASHPDLPGRHVLAIEADGASYHSSHTARDRDRLRQDHLERLGWKFHRIWSTEWFNNRQGCVDAALTAWEKAVAASDSAPLGIPSAVRDEPLAPPTAKSARPPRSGSRPRIRAGEPITSYSNDQLDDLIRWIRSDTLLRTNDELMQEAIDALGYRRKGSRITTALNAAIERTR